MNSRFKFACGRPSLYYRIVKWKEIRAWEVGKSSEGDRIGATGKAHDSLKRGRPEEDQAGIGFVTNNILWQIKFSILVFQLKKMGSPRLSV